MGNDRIAQFLVPNPPVSVTDDLKAWYRSAVVGAYLAIASHVGLVVIWRFLGVQEMVAYHIISFVLLGAVIIFVRTGRIFQAALVVTVEIVLHGVLGIHFIGWQSGMHFPIVNMMFVWSTYPGRRASRYRNFGFAILAVYLGMVLYFPDQTPVYEIDASVLRGIAVTLCSFLVFGMMVVMTLQRVSAEWYEELQEQRAKSEHLLLNVLPAKIAERLKTEECVIADRFDNATVLFLDIVDFTVLSSSMAAHEIVAILNNIFSRFDDLVDSHEMEKIKTIGDAYMAVAGIPEPKPDHARRAASLAVDMLADLRVFSEQVGLDIQGRIGICSGPVVAGVIGKRKFLYDLWGDSVNTASRMESHGVPNQIQVTESTFRILKDDYRFESRGDIEIKGKGKMQTWILIGPR